jgi:hypothetical protein
MLKSYRLTEQKDPDMKPFKLTKDMLTMSGVFYPTGYALVMFPNSSDAALVATELSALAGPEDEVMLLTPQTVLRDIGKVDGDSDITLPSVGTEGATVAKYIQLAKLGQYAVMAKTTSDEHTERVMESVRKVPFSYGQRYHLLAIEDLEP